MDVTSSMEAVWLSASAPTWEPFYVFVGALDVGRVGGDGIGPGLAVPPGGEEPISPLWPADRH